MDGRWKLWEVEGKRYEMKEEKVQVRKQIVSYKIRKKIALTMWQKE